MPSLSSLSLLPTRSKLVLGASALGVLLVAYLLLHLASAPSYTPLTSGLDPAQTGKVTAALDAQGITYKLGNGGTSLAVADGDTARARIALASQGISASGGSSSPGYELFDKQKLGASDFQQKMTYQRALEGEIAKQLGGVQGVAGADVRLVLPTDDLFADTANAATAAVSLKNTADTLQPGAVRGMAQTVASSVKGLKPAGVTITDSTGQLLWPSDAAGGETGGASAKAAAEGRYAQDLETSINAMLSRTLGAGKATVDVRAQLNMDKTVRNELRYAKRGIPMTSQVETEKLKGGSAKAGGAAGTASNIPSYSAGASGAGANSDYQRKSEKTENAIDKTVSKTEVAPGAVEGLHIALLVDKSVTSAAATGAAATGTTGPLPAGPAAIEASVAAAAGLVPARGDTITTTQVAFARPPAAPSAGPVPVGLIGPLKWAGLGLGALAFCFVMLRQLRRRERETLPEPAWLAAC